MKEEHIRTLFDNGARAMARKQAAEELTKIAGVGRSAAYETLKSGGRFAHLLAGDPVRGWLGLKADADNAEM